MRKKIFRLVLLFIVLYVLIMVAAIVIYVVKPEIYHKLIGFGDHSWGEPQIISTLDCGHDGVEKRVCTVCGEESVETTPATDEHSWGEYQTVTVADCIHDGVEKRICTVCGQEDEKITLATGKHDLDEKGVCRVCGTDTSSPIGSMEGVAASDLSIHFIRADNDKAGDCTLIKCGNTEVLIDAGSRQSSAEAVKTYINKYCTDGKLEYVIATHADQDHIAGLVGTTGKNGYNGVLYSYDIGTVIRFDRTNKEATTSTGARSLYGKFLDAVDSAVEKGAVAYTASQCWYQTDGAQKTYFLDTEQKVSMNILYNYYYENNSSDENNYSVCMLLKQEISAGQYKNYLFTGDLEAEGEERLVKDNELPEVELFKAGHHGSPTSSNDCLLSVIKPKYVAVCCCAGTNEYTDTPANQFPSQAFIDRVAPYTDNVFVTNLVSDNVEGFVAMNGDIIFYTDGGKLKYCCSENNIKLKDTDWFKANRTCPTAWAQGNALT